MDAMRLFCSSCWPCWPKEDEKPVNVALINSLETEVNQPEEEEDAYSDSGLYSFPEADVRHLLSPQHSSDDESLPKTTQHISDVSTQFKNGRIPKALNYYDPTL